MCMILNRTGKDELTCGEMNRRDQLEDQEEADNKEGPLESEMKRPAVDQGAGRRDPAVSRPTGMTDAAMPAQFLFTMENK